MRTWLMEDLKMTAAPNTSFQTYHAECSVLYGDQCPDSCGLVQHSCNPYKFWLWMDVFTDTAGRVRFCWKGVTRSLYTLLAEQKLMWSISSAWLVGISVLSCKMGSRRVPLLCLTHKIALVQNLKVNEPEKDGSGHLIWYPNLFRA